MKAKSLKHILKRPLAFLLICALLLPTMILAQAALTTAPDDTAPDVKVVSTLIGGQYLEVGLNIDNKEAGTFQSAGVLLSYDPDMLTPIKWGEVTGEGGAVLEDAKLKLTPETDAATVWDKAVILPSKGADSLSGKLAEAFVLNGKGYLYLSAEAARAMSLRQALPAEVGTAPEGIPATTTSGQAVSGIGKAETAAEEATTVRFLVNTKTETPEGGEAITRPYNLSELASSLDLVTYDGTAGSPNAEAQTLLRYSPLAIDLAATKIAGISYISDNTDYTTAGFDKAVNLEFVWIQEGQTVNSGGGGDLSKVSAVIFYDWDESLMGSKLVAAGDAKQTEEALAAFEMENKSAAASNFDIAMPTLEPIYDGNAPDKKLTYKKGYNFAGWVMVTGDTLDDTFTAFTTQAEFEAVQAKPENFSGDVILKAAYVENKTINTDTAGVASAANEYVLHTVDDTAYIYNRYGAATATTGNYSIKVTASRENSFGNGVTRLKEPALRVQSFPKDSSSPIYSVVMLTGGDIMTGEIVVNKSIDRIEYNFIDFADSSNWTGAAVRSLSPIIKQTDYLAPCTIGAINEQGIDMAKGTDTASWGTFINNIALNEAGLKPKTGTSFNPGTANTAKARLLAEYKINGYQPLTKEEMQALISA